MKLLLARCASASWFLTSFLLLASALGGASGYFAAQHTEPIILLALFTAASLYLNRFTFGTSESYVFILIVAGLGLTLLPLKSSSGLGTAVCGLYTGFLASLAALDWMDKPNEAERQAREQQAN